MPRVSCDICGARGVVSRAFDGRGDICGIPASICGICKKKDEFELRLVLPEHQPNIGGCRDSIIAICMNTKKDVEYAFWGLHPIRACGSVIDCWPQLFDSPVYVGQCRKRAYVWEKETNNNMFTVTFSEVTLSSRLRDDVWGAGKSIRKFTVHRDQVDWVISGKKMTIGLFDANYYSNRCTVCGCGLGSMNPRQLCGKYICQNEGEISPPSIYAQITGVVCERSDRVFGMQFLHVQEEVNVAIVLAIARGDPEGDGLDDDDSHAVQSSDIHPVSLLHRRVAFPLELSREGFLNPVVTPPVESCYIIVLAAAHYLRFTQECIPLTVWDRIFWWAAEFLLADSPGTDCVLLRGAPVISSIKKKIQYKPYTGAM